MVLGDDRIEGGGAEDDLLAIGGAEPGPSPGRGGGLGPGGRIAGELEEGGLLGPGPSAIGWGAHGEIITVNLALGYQTWCDPGFFHKL
jgi:hypothetical protein